jgi:hypothetical protein
MAMVLAGAAAHAQTGAIALVVAPDSVTIQNVPPGGSVVLFTIARTTVNRRIHLENWGKVLRDDDGDGMVRFDPERNRVPPRSVWVAVDMASGSHAVGAHPGFPLYHQPLAPESLRRQPGLPDVAALELELPRLMLLLVRPGKGAWILFGIEGGPGDGDASANRKLSMLFEQADSISGKEKAPQHLLAGDFIAAIDPGHLDVWTTVVGK